MTAPKSEMRAFRLAAARMEKLLASVRAGSTTERAAHDAFLALELKTNAPEIRGNVADRDAAWALVCVLRGELLAACEAGRTAVRAAREAHLATLAAETPREDTWTRELRVAKL